MKTELNHLSKVITCLLLAGTTAPIMAETFDAKVPWIKQVLSANQFGGNWAQTSDLYVQDLTGDGNPDLIRLNPVEDDFRSIQVFINRKKSLNPSITNFAADIESFYKAGQTSFQKITFWEGQIPNSSFKGDQIRLNFANIDNAPGIDMVKIEDNVPYAKDTINTATLYGGYRRHTVQGQSGTYGGFCSRQDLPEMFNGYYGSGLYTGDFNNDGMDDFLRVEWGPWSDDHILTVNVYYGGRDYNNRRCGYASPTLTKAPDNFVISSNSDGQDENPQALFDFDDTSTKIGDFNNDGFSDILNFDINDNLGTDRERASVFFGGNNKLGQFERSYIYLDANGNSQKESAESTIGDKLKGFDRYHVHIGDYNGDGADDILAYKNRDMTIFLSKAVESVYNPETSKYEPNKRKIGLFEEVNLPNVVDFNLGDSNVKVKIADFNNDGRDDILAWNNQPYILYSHTPDNQDSAGKAIALTTIKHSNVLDGNTVYNDRFNAIGNVKLLQVADFTNDGYPDILAVSSVQENASLFITPTYNPLESVRTNYAGNIEHSEGTTYKGNNLVFFNDNGTLKYMARNQFGWQSPKDVPLYLKTGDARCNNDLPENGLFLAANQFDSTTPSYQSGKSYYTQPVCNANYHGEVFDVTADDKYIYLFRAYNDPSDPNHSQNRNNQVLLDRFIYNSAANRLERLTEARYQISEQRYKATANSRISTTNSRGQTFREPAFTVPFIGQIKGGTACPIESVTVSLMKDAVDTNRFVLASSCLGNGIKLASVRQGGSQPFNTEDFIYQEELTDNDGQVTSTTNKTIPGVALSNLLRPYIHYSSLDSVVFNATVDASNDQGNQLNLASAFKKLFIASGSRQAPAPVNEFSSNLTFEVEMDKFGNFTDFRVNGVHAPVSSSTVTPYSRPRLHFASDGLVHLYWRIADGTLVESVLDPTLKIRNNKLENSWLLSNNLSQDILKMNWPVYTRTYQDNAWGDYSSRFNIAGQIYKPKFGSYYTNKSRILGNSNSRTTPVIFEYGSLIEKDGRQKGILKRAFLDSLNINFSNASQKSFAINEQNLTELEAQFIGRYSTNAKVIGFMEGAPPIPRENLGRDQNGRWGYTESAASVDLEFNQGTSVTISKDSNVGLGASGLAGYQGFYISAYLKGDFATGGSRNYVLSTQTTRSTIASGAIPARPCLDSESPYLEACHKTEDGELVELWKPFNKGAIWATVLSADLVALTNPETNRTVGYAIDFTSAQENNKIVSFDINPSYQVAGSLDGYIGNVPVSSLAGGSRYKSYFKPLEERQWNITSERQKQELEKRYEQNRGVQNGLEDNSTFAQDTLLMASNTIALGAHQADGTTAAANITDYVGKALEVGAAIGYKTPDGVKDLFGLNYELEAAGSFKVERRHTKDQTFRNSFNSHINRAISSEIQDEYGNTLPYKVDQYTSRSYFIPASLENYNTLLNDVFDQNRLSNMSLSDQQVIEDLKSSPNKIWRVVHRVDAISRAMPNPFNN